MDIRRGTTPYPAFTNISGLTTNMELFACLTVCSPLMDVEGHPILGQEARTPVATHFCISLLNEEHVIGHLPLCVP
ncbi:hypothetical protein NPIL_218311 [Nephila pilipes]|uniref:Uncharacterized protein n=1 Tax=Nephila pilipes TaxID=299642 RepID=A0A8X6N534_NEPPI|nr:hypothetical protein NPIL_218311 [Nephila pilipes]